MAQKGKSSNVIWQEAALSQEARSRLLEQRPCVLWMTGLSGSGKSTIAKSLENKLFNRGKLSFVLDGDNVRHGLNGDLGFTAEDRQENIRRVAQVSALFADAGLISIVALISPFRESRKLARSIIGDQRFVEIFVDASLNLCKERDPKGLYEKALAGEIKEFTGIDSPYEEPESANIHISTANVSPAKAAETIITHLDELGFLRAETSEK